jgi:cell division protein FtsQ
VAGVPELTVADRPAADERRRRRRAGTGWREAARVRFSLPGPDGLPDPSPDPLSPPDLTGGTIPDGVGPSDLSGTPTPDAPRPTDDGPSAAAPPIDPRFRQRRLDVEAQHGRRRTHALVAATSVLTVAAIGFGVLHSPLLVVRRHRVSGEVQTSAADVLHAAGLDRHPLMIDLDLRGATAAIGRLPWIATARVRRSWPDTVIVTVTERVPAAVIAGMLVDASGRVLSVAPSFAALVPVGADRGTTPPPVPRPGGEVAAVYRPGLMVATAIPPALRPAVGAVLGGAGGVVRLTLTEGASALLGDTTALGQKLEAVLTVVDRVRIGHGTIDARVPSAPVLTS